MTGPDHYRRRDRVLALMECDAELRVRCPGEQGARVSRRCWREIAEIEVGARWPLIGPSGALAEAKRLLVAESMWARGLCPTCRRKVGYRTRTASGECGECAEQRRACACGRHRFGEWAPCDCEGAIADHWEWFGLDHWCGWEFRTCLTCTASEERHADDLPTQPLPIRQGSEAGA